MQRGEYLAGQGTHSEEKQKEKQKNPFHNAFYSEYLRTLTFEMLLQTLLLSCCVDRRQDEWNIEFVVRFQRYAPRTRPSVFYFSSAQIFLPCRFALLSLMQEWEATGKKWNTP
jgi:hypothetical protein